MNSTCSISSVVYSMICSHTLGKVLHFVLCSYTCQPRFQKWCLKMAPTYLHEICTLYNESVHEFFISAEIFRLHQVNLLAGRIF